MLSSGGQTQPRPCSKSPRSPDNTRYGNHERPSHHHVRRRDSRLNRRNQRSWWRLRTSRTEPYRRVGRCRHRSAHHITRQPTSADSAIWRLGHERYNTPRTAAKHGHAERTPSAAVCVVASLPAATASVLPVRLFSVALVELVFVSGAYLRTGTGALGLWRWWLVNSGGATVYTGPYAYSSREAAIGAAHKSA